MPAKPSSSSEGFFQEAPVLENPFHDDEALQRALKFFLPSSTYLTLAPSLTTTGSHSVSPHTLTHLSAAERHPPTLISHTPFGVRQDALITSPGWQTLQSLGLSLGAVSSAYPKTSPLTPLSRLHQFAILHLWTPSSAMTTCPVAMTDGAAKLLSYHVSENEVFKRAFERLTSTDPKEAWTSGQWMTERMGGSDVSGTETVARWDAESERAGLGEWSISGFKWFSSATDADCAILLAQTGKGLSCFFADVREPEVPGIAVPKEQRRLNGVRIQRLKNKLGTKALPTAELELVDMRGWLVGEEGQGVREISRVLNVTRLHTAVTAVGYWGRGLQVARAYARVRRIKGGKVRLLDVPAHVAGLAEGVVGYRANVMLMFLVVALLGREEEDEKREGKQKGAAQGDAKGKDWKTRAFIPQDPAQVSLLLRVLTPITKALASKAAIAGLQECMEALGGVGYLENEDPALNIARLFRDVNVLSIWEGTTDIMADDLVRVVKGRQSAAALDALEIWLDGMLDGVGFDLERLATEVSVRFQDWRKQVVGTEADELRARGQSCMKMLGWIVCAALLLSDAGSSSDGGDTDRDGAAIAAEVAKRWFARMGKEDFGPGRDWREECRVNRRLVLGTRMEDEPMGTKSRL